MTSADGADGNQRDQGGDPHAEAGDLPGDQREDDNRHRRRHPQQQLLEGAEDVVDRHADPLE